MKTITSVAELPTKERGVEISEEWSEDLLDVAPPPFSKPSRALFQKSALLVSKLSLYTYTLSL